MKDETFKKVVDVLIADGCTPLDCIDLMQRMATYIKGLPSDTPRTTKQDALEFNVRWELTYGHTDTNPPTGYVDKVAFTLVATATQYKLSKGGVLVKQDRRQHTTSTTFAHVVTANAYLYARNPNNLLGTAKKLVVWAPFANKTPTGTQTAPVFREDV